MAQYDWSEFELYYYYKTSLKDTWKAWASGKGLTSFFIEKCETRNPEGILRAVEEDFQAGDSYRWEWRHGHPIEGEILHSLPMKELVFTFGGMRVDLAFSDTEGGIRVHLKQSGIPVSDEGKMSGHLNCRSCWIFFMTNLLSVLEQGVDLRHSDPGRVSSMEVGFIPPEMKEE